LTTQIRLTELKPHEETDPHNLERVLAALSHGTSLDDYPIYVDRDSLVILDGHHRYEASIQLGLESVPCVLVDYHSPEIQLEPRRTDLLVTKEEVIRRALAGELYPPKTTRHIFHSFNYDSDDSKI